MTPAATLAAILAPHCNPDPAGFTDGVAVTVAAVVILAALAAWRTRTK